jgi:Acetyltransferase (GNAT) domain
LSDFAPGNQWHTRSLTLKFAVGDFVYARRDIPLLMREAAALAWPAVSDPPLPADAPAAAAGGCMIRSLPVTGAQPVISRCGAHIRYIPQQYRRHFADLTLGWEAYRAGFSSKSRATLERKVRRYTQSCGGELKWQVCRSAAEAASFFTHARSVSRASYQERLLDVGLPEGEDYRRHLETLAAANRFRGYLLFDREKPVSYLLLTGWDGVLRYEYLGYLPDYAGLSAGTVLHWLALEDLLKEQQFHTLDFTEGESEQKRLFGTRHVECVNAIYLPWTWRNRLLVQAHHGSERASKWLGHWLDRLGVKARLRQLLRR